MGTIKVLKVDFNGTIIDDWQSAYTASSAVLEYYGYDIPLFDEYVRELALSGDYYGYYARRGKIGSRDEVYQIFIKAYAEHSSGIQVFTGVHEALENIVESGVEIHLVTAAREDFAGRLVDKTGINKYLTKKFFHVLDKADTINNTLSSQRLKVHECAMIGDLPSDVRSAKKAGILGIAWLNHDVPLDVFKDVYSMDYVTSCRSDFAKYIVEKE